MWNEPLIRYWAGNWEETAEEGTIILMVWQMQMLQIRFILAETLPHPLPRYQTQNTTSAAEHWDPNQYNLTLNGE